LESLLPIWTELSFRHQLAGKYDKAFDFSHDTLAKKEREKIVTSELVQLSL
jgi:hypothetical protein